MSRPDKRTSGAAKGNILKGFTLLELIVVISILGILAVVAYPAMSRFVPNQKVSNEAKRVESFLQKARVNASTKQRPIRVVINCVASPCWIESQKAVYNGASVDSWTPEGDRRYFNTMVSLVNSTTTGGRDGAREVPGVRYAIYMPDGRVYSDPRPFDIFLFSNQVDSAVNPKEGWRISVTKDSGRVATKRTELTTS
ncbi:MAG: prepilin-type N-terminal cleavage/methylation domain-containing protein [Deltaproteobacteria bacterium]|jgi:prepilin-type N-terminal cleavage/methylation domain-containing protein|nr:prepilin-type N-terminal cleavage/methylation domain-containing protein [Deltaproteobacteria bacterium]